MQREICEAELLNSLKTMTRLSLFKSQFNMKKLTCKFPKFTNCFVPSLRRELDEKLKSYG